MFVIRTKTAELIELSLGECDPCRSKETCIRWGQGRTNPFVAARGDKTAMWPFVKILWPLFPRSCRNVFRFLLPCDACATRKHIALITYKAHRPVFVCLSVRHKPARGILSKWLGTYRTGFGHTGYSRFILRCVITKFERISKIRVHCTSSRTLSQTRNLA